MNREQAYIERMMEKESLYTLREIAGESVPLCFLMDDGGVKNPEAMSPYEIRCAIRRLYQDWINLKVRGQHDDG